MVMEIIGQEDEFDAAMDEFAKAQPEKEVKEEKKVQKEEKKEISIDWANVPVQALMPKLKKALGCTIIETIGDTNTCRVSSGDHTYVTTSVSCTCKDWQHRGTSTNPCKHMLFLKYGKEGIQDLIAQFKEVESPLVMKQETDEYMEGLVIPSIMPHLAEVGKIKIGGKGEKSTQSGFLLPEKWDHFAIATLTKDNLGKLIMDDELNAKIGDNPKELDIYLCFDNPLMNMPTFYAHFTQNKLVCMGNGKKARKTFEDGTRSEITCNIKDCQDYKEKKCKPYGRLSVILADSNRIGGVYVFRTTSWNTIRNVLSSMSFIHNLTGGILAGIPLKMKLMSITVTPNRLGKNVTIYVVNIEFKGSMKELKEAAQEELKRRQALGINMVSIEKGHRHSIAERAIEEAKEEAVDIEDEFYVDVVEEEE